MTTSETWTDAALPTTPGVYSVPTGQPVTLPEPSGHMEHRDVGKYRLLSQTDENGTVTNWLRELPDGEWAKVQGGATRHRLVIPAAIENDTAALEQFIDKQCERDGLVRFPGRIRTDCVASADETLVFAEFPAAAL